MALRPPWKYESPSCANTDTAIFYPIKDELVIRPSLAKELRKICVTCPHIDDCAEWGIQKETHGFWGGLTAEERVSVYRKRGRRKYTKKSFCYSKANP